MAATVVLLGPPGSGKGTQATRLRDALGLMPLVAGDLLRGACAEGTELGRRASGYMERGELVPDALIAGLIGDAIAAHRDEPVVLDGFPRNVAQAGLLHGTLRVRSRELTAVVLIDVPDDVAAQRIGGRADGRADDRPETVRERLRVYHHETEPLVAYYEQRGLLLRVDGCHGADVVSAGIREALDGIRVAG